MTRIDTEGRDVTDLPGLWSEDDREVGMTDAERKRVVDVLQCTVSYTSDRDTTGPLKHYANEERFWSRSGMLSLVRELDRKLKIVTEVNKALLKELESGH